MARSLLFTILTSSLLGLLSVGVWTSAAVHAAPRNSFPGRRIGGGTRGECAARPIVHLVPASSVYAPGPKALIGWLEGPSLDPQPVEVTLHALAADGRVDPVAPPVLSKQVTAAANRLVLLSVPSGPRPLLWESSYRCGPHKGEDEFGFISTSAPPARSRLVQQGGQDDQQLQLLLASLKASCGATSPLAPLKAALQLGDDLIDDSWPESVTVECF